MPPFRAAVLAGGRSRRMGTDKAFVEIDGRPLVVRAVDALLAAGAHEVHVIGGDLPRLTALGLTPVADHAPGEGPLGAVLTALRLTESAEPVVVLSCDLRDPSPEAVRSVLGALHDAPEAALAVPVTVDGPQWLHAAWRPHLAEPGLAEAFAGGVRSVWRAVEHMARVEVRDVPPASLADVDRPSDLLADRNEPPGAQ